MRMQLPTLLVFIGCILSGPIPLLKRRIICRPVFEQKNTYYTAVYVTERILSETQKINYYIKQQTDTIKQHSRYSK